MSVLYRAGTRNSTNICPQLAIIASDFPLWKKIIEAENVGVTVNPKDAKEIGAAIDSLLIVRTFVTLWAKMALWKSA